MSDKILVRLDVSYEELQAKYGELIETLRTVTCSHESLSILRTTCGSHELRIAGRLVRITVDVTKTNSTASLLDRFLGHVSFCDNSKSLIGELYLDNRGNVFADSEAKDCKGSNTDLEYVQHLCVRLANLLFASVKRDS